MTVVTRRKRVAYFRWTEREERRPTTTIAERPARVPIAVIAMKSITTCSMPSACRMERITAAIMMAGLGLDFEASLVGK